MPPESVSSYPRRNLLITAFLAAVFALAIAGTGAAFAPVRLADKTSFAIPQGSGSRKIGAALKSRRLVRSKWAFVAYATLAGRASDLKPGEYEFEKQVSIGGIVKKLVAGPNNEKTITVPEGWDLFDLAAYFEREGIASPELFWRLTGKPSGSGSAGAPELESEALSALAGKPRNANLEGYLFPDTYRVYRDASAENVLSAMIKNFAAKFSPEFLSEIRGQGKTVHEIVTMASLIEKEVKTERDRKIVSGILWKRLETGMPLQVDAAVTYPYHVRRTPNAEELRKDSPYNTYLRTGLPPGPIGNPGLDAVRAALHPEESSYWYYFSRADGKTVFSETFEKHKAARGLR